MATKLIIRLPCFHKFFRISLLCFSYALTFFLITNMRKGIVSSRSKFSSLTIFIYGNHVRIWSTNHLGGVAVGVHITIFKPLFPNISTILSANSSQKHELGSIRDQANSAILTHLIPFLLIFLASVIHISSGQFG